MRIRTCPELVLLEQLEDGGALVLHPVTGSQHELALPVAQLLDALAQAEDVATITGDAAGIPEALIRQLLDVGLLVEDGPFEAIGQALALCDPTFAGCPYGHPGLASICILGVPCDLSNMTDKGVALGPTTIRKASSPPYYQQGFNSSRGQGWYDSYADRRILAGLTMVDCGDVALPDPRETVTGFIEICAMTGAFPLVLGGDHSITHSVVAGLASRDIGILHIDGHADVGLSATEFASRDSVVRDLLELEHVVRVVSVGLRGFLAWKEDADREGRRVIPISEARDLGSEGILAELNVDMPWYVTIDASALDPSIAPNSNSPVPGGFTYSEIRDLVAILSKREVVGADFVELNGEGDVSLASSRTMAHVAIGLLGAVFGDRAAGE